MANVNIYNMNGDVVGSMELNDKIFGAEVNKSVLHSVVRAYLLNQRQGTQSTLTRTEVSGGGRKPWRQKGTGRARQGSTRSPQWTHGGVSINKKVKRVAMLSALSSKVQAGELIVVDNIALAEYKTKSVVAMLKALGAEKKAYIVTEEINPVFVKSAANIPAVKTTPVNAINVYDILNSNKMVVSKQAVMKIEEVYAE